MAPISTLHIRISLKPISLLHPSNTLRRRSSNNSNNNHSTSSSSNAKLNSSTRMQHLHRISNLRLKRTILAWVT